MPEQPHEHLGIAFSRKRASVLIYKSTLRALGKPNYVRILPNPSRKRIALQVCAKQEMGAIHISKKNMKGKSVIICSLVIQRILWEIGEWHKNSNYRIYGTLFHKNEIVEFLLSDAEVISDEDFIDPECEKT